MQSLYGSLIRRLNLNTSHFKSTLAYLPSKIHGLSLFNYDSSYTTFSLISPLASKIW
ncbi:hypothetical protein Peur_069749 [Populus x canadensis]